MSEYYRDLEPLIEELHKCPTLSISKHKLLGLIKELPVVTKEEIRAEVIDEFMSKAKQTCSNTSVGADRKLKMPLYLHKDGTWHSLLDDVAEQLKGGAKDENN